MTTWNNGGVTFNRCITEAEAAVINRLDFCTEAEADDDELLIEDVYGDIEPALRTLCEVMGEMIDDIAIDYFGDYDGGYRFVDGKLKSLDKNDLGIIDASDEKLIDELKRRGYVVTKNELSEEA